MLYLTNTPIQEAKKGNTVKTRIFKNLSTSLIFLCMSMGQINAEDLKDIYELALLNDPTFKEAEASFRAGQEYKVQGRAGLLPSLNLSGSTGWNEYRLEEQLLDEYNSNNYSVSLQQPLFRLDRWFQFKQGKALTDSAKAEFAFQQQEIMIRVATSYFNILNARDSLSASKAEEEAIGRQREQSEKRFEVGLASITELQDTQAAYDLSVVGTIIGESQLDSAKEFLSAIIGGSLPLLSPLIENYPTPPPNPISRESWVKLALSNNFQLKAARLNTTAAKNNARASGSAHLPKIDIVGRVTKSSSRQGKFGGFIQNPLYDLESDNRQYQIQVNFPLFAGGAISSSRRQAYAQYDRSKEQSLFIERSVIREVRSNHFNVQTQSANVIARRQALKSSESALEATRIGYEVGNRNVVDLLQSERGLYAAQRDYAKSRYDYIIAVLRLKSSVGSLSPNDLFEVSSRME